MEITVKVFSAYVEPKHQSDEYNQAAANDFQHWIFWMCQQSLAWYKLIILN